MKEGLMKNTIIAITVCLVMSFALQVHPAVLDLPPRPADAPGGDAFVVQITDLEREDREEEIYDEIASGNIPAFLRNLVKIEVTENIDNTQRKASYFVTPDYLAVGSDDDYFLTPMTPTLAQRIANLVNAGLPTRKMVDDIYEAAEVKLAPKPISPSPEMTTVPVFDDHNEMVWEQRSAVLDAHPLGDLVGGTKKDIVVTNRIQTQLGRVAIYGWRQLNGEAIQPLSLVHSDTYADYSHGVRLVLLDMTVDGEHMSVRDVLGNEDLAPLLSDEGTIEHPYYPVSEPTPTPTPTPFNPVTNGSFENGFSSGVGNGWTAWKTDDSNLITYGQASLNIHDGSHSQYWARSDEKTFDGGVYQLVSVKPGYRYRITSWLKRQSVSEGTFLSFGYDPGGGTNGESDLVVYTDLTESGDNQWIKYEETVTTTQDELTLFCRGGHRETSGGSISYFYVDEVRMESLGAAPAEMSGFVFSGSPRLSSYIRNR